jgi:hypothetical protein
MAQKITVELEDDLDGGPADETVRFGVDSAEYEIDLSKKNAAAFRKKLAPFTIMPARLGGDSAAGRGGPRVGSAAAIPGVGERPGRCGQRPRAHPASVVAQCHAATKGRWHTPRSRPGQPCPDHPGADGQSAASGRSVMPPYPQPASERPDLPNWVRGASRSVISVVCHGRTAITGVHE